MVIALTSPSISFIMQFEQWLLTDFARADRSIQAYNLDPEELVDLLRPWVELASELIGPRLGQLHPHDARALRGLINHALHRLEHHCDRREQRFADVLSLLHPLDDLLVALSLAERGLFQNQQAGVPR